MAGLEQTERAPEVKGRSSLAGLWSVSTLFMAILAVCFVLQQIIIVRMEKPYDAYIGLSWSGMKSGYLWELLTYQCLHQGWVQLLINLAGLWFAGRWLEGQLGGKRFALFYQGTIVAGGVLQNVFQLASSFLPRSMDTLADVLMNKTGGQVGSSAGLCGLWAALCWYRGGDGTRVLGKYGLPLFWSTVIAAAVLLFVPSDPELAHLAHLGGLLTGMFLSIRMSRAANG